MMKIGSTTTQAILFDLDGTLIDSAPDLGAAADKMRTDRGLAPYPLERYRPMAGAGARGMLGIAFGITPEAPEFDALREEFYVGYERRMLLNTLVFDGVAPLIEAIRERGLRWGVVTNKSARFTEPLTAAMPLFASAGAIVSGDTTPFAKPHPEPLHEAARRLGVAPEACIYVGTTSATSSRAAPQAWEPWRPPTATWVLRPMRRCGKPMPQSLRPWSS